MFYYHRYNRHIGKKIIGATFLIALAGLAMYLLKRDRSGVGRLRGWIYRLQGEAMDRLEAMGNVSREKYNELVDQLAEQYAGLKNIDRRELEDGIRDIKMRWHAIKNQVREGRDRYRGGDF